ncbi:amidase domain-containing protein, partial [Bacillus sp. B-TM1]
YDFEDDGRWNHTTIVVAKDADGMPLVNAHSANSRRRYWNYNRRMIPPTIILEIISDDITKNKVLRPFYSFCSKPCCST